MAGISSDDRQRAQELVARLDALRESVRELPIPLREEQLGRVSELAASIRARQTDELLSKLDVEVLEPCGIETDKLRKIGYPDLGTLHTAIRLGRSSVRALPHVERLTQLVEQVYQSTYDRVPCLIDATTKPKEHEELLSEITLVDNMIPVRNKRDAIAQQAEQLASHKEVLSNLPGFLGNIFMGRARREQVVSSLAQLQEQVPALEQRAATLKQDVAKLVDRAYGQAWQSYEKDAGHYDQRIIDLAHSPAFRVLPMLSVDLMRSSVHLDSQISQLRARVKGIHVPTEPEQRGNIKKQADALRDEQVLQILGGIDVSVLKGAGINTLQLSRKGYHSIADLVDAHRNGRLVPRQIQEASKVTQSILKIYGAALKVTPLVIDASRRTHSQTELLSSVRKLWNLSSLGKDRKTLNASVDSLAQDNRLFREHHVYQESLYLHQGDITTCKRVLRKNEAALGRLTTSADKLANALSPSEGDVWKDYIGRSGTYQNTLRQVAQLPSQASMPVADPELALEAHDWAFRLNKTLHACAGITLPNLATERKELLELVATVKKHDAEQRLNSIDLDVLAYGNVRVGPLKTAGYNTVGSLYGKTATQLSRIPRVTYDTAREIVRAVDDIYRSAVESARCRIDAEKKPTYQTNLVKALFKSLQHKDLRRQLDEITETLSKIDTNAKNLRSRFDYLENVVVTDQRHQLIARQVGCLESELPTAESKVRELSNQAMRLSRATAAEAWQDFEHNAASYYALLEELGAVGLEEMTGDLPKRLVDQVASFKLDISNLKVTLRRYQRFGAQYALHQAKTLIGDEMGLGKTVEAIATMAHLYAKGERYFMVVCPLSVLINWSREVPKHSKLRANPIHGGNREHDFYLWCLHGGVAVTTYETISRLDWGWLKDRRIAMLVADEAHYVKNPDAKRTKALVEIALARSDRALFLTGTPLENKVEEMNALIGYLNPKLVDTKLGNATHYNPIRYRQDIAPVYLRRKREDVLSELPRKVEEEDWCELTRDDLADYCDSLSLRNFSAMRRVGWRHNNLRRSSKAQRLLEICEEAKANGSKVLVFSFFLDTIGKVAQLLGNDCIGVISGRIPAARRQELIDEFTDSDRTVLVSQVTAGGVGLNIQAASIIVFCEPQLKPSIEDQAISRSYRMGQVRTVVVHRLLMSKTVDDRVVEILNTKRRAFEAYADESQMGKESLGIVDTTAILEIIEDERRRYNVRGGKAAPSTSSNASDGIGSK